MPYDNPEIPRFIVWSKGFAYWRPSKRYAKAQHGMKPVRLTGQQGDGLDHMRDAEALALTKELRKRCGESSHLTMGTWGWLIHHYQTDPYSRFNSVKENTRESYAWQIDRWDKAIGHLPIAALTFREIKGIEAAMIAKPRTKAYIHRMFTMLRGLCSYGIVALESEAAAKVKGILSEITFPKGPQRNVVVTREQITAIIAEADNQGMEDFALGLTLQWVFALRAVDVRGQWLQVRKATEGGIVRISTRKIDGKYRAKITRWQDGLTWDDISPDFSTMTKVISKTSKTLDKPITLDLTATPGVQERLRRLARVRDRVGPLILADELPYTMSGWNNAFARIRDKLGLPKEITAMDIRAGAATEMENMGLNNFAMRDALGHSTVQMTSRYARGRSEGANKVVQLRGGK
jgi:integrase